MLTHSVHRFLRRQLQIIPNPVNSLLRKNPYNLCNDVQASHSCTRGPWRYMQSVFGLAHDAKISRSRLYSSRNYQRSSELQVLYATQACVHIGRDRTFESICSKPKSHLKYSKHIISSGNFNHSCSAVRTVRNTVSVLERPRSFSVPSILKVSPYHNSNFTSISPQSRFDEVMASRSWQCV